MSTSVLFLILFFILGPLLSMYILESVCQIATEKAAVDFDWDCFDSLDQIYFSILSFMIH